MRGTFLSSRSALMEFFRRHFSNIVCFPGANNMKRDRRRCHVTQIYFWQLFVNTRLPALRAYINLSHFTAFFSSKKQPATIIITPRAPHRSLCLSLLRLMDWIRQFCAALLMRQSIMSLSRWPRFCSFTIFATQFCFIRTEKLPVWWVHNDKQSGLFF